MATKKTAEWTGREYGPGILQKQVKIQEAMGFLEFDAENIGQKYGYMSAAGVLRKLNVLLTENKVVMSVVHESCETQFGDHLKNNVSIVHQTVRFTCAETGDWFETQATGGGKDSHDKGPMKASTAALKYNIAHPFCLGWGAADPEATNDADRPGKPSKAKKAKSDFDALAAIDAAKDMATLNGLAAKLTLMPEGKDKDAARAAFTKKKETLG